MPLLFGKKLTAVRFHKRYTVLKNVGRLCLIVGLGLWHTSMAQALTTQNEAVAAIAKANDTKEPLSNILKQPTTRGVFQSPQTRRSALMVFTSLGVPEATLKAEIRETQHAGASLLLRGFVDNRLAKTKTVIHGLLKQLKGGFSINPIAFEKLHISRVPAVVLLKAQALHCLDLPNCQIDHTHEDKITGNVTLIYALRQFSHTHTPLDSLAKKYLKTLQGAQGV